MFFGGFFFFLAIDNKELYVTERNNFSIDNVYTSNSSLKKKEQVGRQKKKENSELLKLLPDEVLQQFVFHMFYFHCHCCS